MRLINKIACRIKGHNDEISDAIVLTYKPGNKIPGYFGRIQETRTKEQCKCCKRIKISTEIKEVDSYYDN